MTDRQTEGTVTDRQAGGRMTGRNQEAGLQTNKQEEYSNIRHTDKQNETDRQVGTSTNN